MLSRPARGMKNLINLLHGLERRSQWDAWVLLVFGLIFTVLISLHWMADVESAVNYGDAWFVLFAGTTITLLGFGLMLSLTTRDITAQQLRDEITERTRSQHELQASETRYRRLFESAKDGILILDAESGLIVDVNPFLIDLMRFSRESFLGKKVWELGFFKDLVANEANFTELQQKGYVRYDDMALKTSDGRRVDVEFVSNVYDVDGKQVIQCNIRDITERKRTQEVLRTNQSHLINALQMSRAGHWEYDVGSDVFTFNDNFYQLFRTSAAEEGGYQMSSSNYARKFCHPDDAPLVIEETKAAINSTDPNYRRQLEHRILYPDGEVGYISVRFSIVKDSKGRTVKTYGVNQDVTERKRAEVEREILQAQFTQAQKMESVGRLAGGVAHDFNNLLMGIMGYTELCREGITPDHPIREWLDAIMQAAQRSAEITRQLLAFARKQIIEPKVLDMNEAVSDMLKLLRHLIGEDINLVWKPGANLKPVRLDPSQVDQLLANLCINARDAIAGVGKITLETASVLVGKEYCIKNAEAIPGAYVLLAVSDDGCGMDQPTLAQIFEPFFTTKGVGEGTGLGLATVYGIVKQNNGFINAYSERGHGTTFKIYLPQVAPESTTATVISQPPVPRGNGETILIVEDEKSLSLTCGIFLESLGYVVLKAETPGDALKAVAGHLGDIHLLLTDVIMPGMDGRQLSERVLAAKSRTRVLFMSGYTADVIAQRGVLEENVAFIGKPFSRDDLARKVHEVLRAGFKRVAPLRVINHESKPHDL